MQGDQGTDNKISILYYDDQVEFREAFIERHRDRFSIETAADISDVLGELERRTSLPNLLVLDLYHDIDRSDTGQAQRVADARTALGELKKMIQQVKAKVDLAWEPVALETLRRIRERFSADELPIVIYSQRGLFFLDEGQLEQVENAQAHWMLKEKGEHYEADRITRLVAQGPKKRLARDVMIAGASVAAGVVIPFALQHLW